MADKTATHSSLLSHEVAFTQFFEKFEREKPELRELNCLKFQYPAILRPAKEGDWFAGRQEHPLVGISPEEFGFGYFCNRNKLENILKETDNDEIKDQVLYLLDFWKQRTTSHKCRQGFSHEMMYFLSDGNFETDSAIAFPLYRLAGIILDYDKLLKKGLPGLKSEIEERLKNANTEEEKIFLECSLAALQLVRDVCIWYVDLVRKGFIQDTKAKKIIESCLFVADNPPATFHQAIQLFWMYTLIADTLNYGRMDVYLGDFLSNDLKNGTISEEEANDYIYSLWILMRDRGNIWNNRIIVGGKGRRNAENADLFALMAMEATKRIHDILPVLALRTFEGQDPRLMEKALDVIAEGNPYPILYNDDINVAAVARAFDISEQDAENYLMFGCGEYVIDHCSVGTPNGTINLLKALNVTLYNGVDDVTGSPAGVALGKFSEFDTFEKLLATYKKQVELHVDELARAQQIIYEEAAHQIPFLLISVLTDNCIERAKPLLRGGVKIYGGTLETYANSSTGDALYAIKKLVYEKQMISQEKLLYMLSCNFEGFERERKMLAALPKFGNDNAEVDEMVSLINEHVCRYIRDQREKTSLDSYLAVIINNWGNIFFGKTTGASADGRFAGHPFSNANAPTSGNDVSGITALLNSMAKLDAGIHAGSVQNLKVSKGLLKKNKSKIEALISAYFKKGGTQLMITCVNKEELEDAMINPEKYPDLLVRVGGFSARFVELGKDTQTDIINRTQY